MFHLFIYLIYGGLFGEERFKISINPFCLASLEGLGRRIMGNAIFTILFYVVIYIFFFIYLFISYSGLHIKQNEVHCNRKPFGNQTYMNSIVE